MSAEASSAGAQAVPVGVADLRPSGEFAVFEGVEYQIDWPGTETRVFLSTPPGMPAPLGSWRNNGLDLRWKRGVERTRLDRLFDRVTWAMYREVFAVTIYRFTGDVAYVYWGEEHRGYPYSVESIVSSPGWNEAIENGFSPLDRHGPFNNHIPLAELSDFYEFIEERPLVPPPPEPEPPRHPRKRPKPRRL